MLPYPANSSQWKKINRLYLDFRKEARNLRLRLVTDGINIFDNLIINHSLWLVFSSNLQLAFLVVHDVDILITLGFTSVKCNRIPIVVLNPSSRYFTTLPHNITSQHHTSHSFSQYSRTQWSKHNNTKLIHINKTNLT